jgi:prepilin-type N-terminal cleavage/methylation domain-containing protein
LRIEPDQIRGKAGFTLVEYMVGIAVGSLVLLAVASLSLYSGRSFAGLANYADLNSASLRAIDQMTRDIRQATGVLSFSTNEVVLDYGTNAPAMAFTYSPSDRVLVRTHGAEKSVLLKECDFLEFRVFQRTPKAGTYDQFPTATPNTAKVLEVKWISSRTIFGTKFNTENAQTAKIVIRKN